MGFFVGYPWRFLFTDIPTAPDCAPPNPSTGGIVTTWADGLLSARQIALTLDAPTVITASVYPDDPRVNAIFTDGDPLVAQGNRLLYCFRREGRSGSGTDETGPWVCRAAGIVMSPEDEADADSPLTHLSAYDPWQYLAGRPCVNASGTLPDDEGFVNGPETIFGVRGDQMALVLLKNTIQASCEIGGGFCFVDAGDGSRSGEGAQYADYGGTSFYGGTIEETDDIVYNVQQGQAVKDVWDDLCDAGNMDIVLEPIYDPVNRPGYTHELSIYNLAGTERPSAVFGWDRMNRSLTTIDRMHDGTPPNFANKVNYYIGTGGFPVATQTNADSVAKYLPAWAVQFFSSQTIPDPTGALVLQMAQQALRLGRQGRRTLTVDATPERSPLPFVDYDIGDRVPVYGSNNLRATIDGYQRVEGIPISILDDGTEQVQSLLMSPDWRDGS